jgi:transcriptional regulator with PAS, ATPase and Fis domain
MVALAGYIRRVAEGATTVLVTGETGTGKELIAQLIHVNSPRRTQPFVPINCAAVPDTLIESELFGYERGAFTGADAAKKGWLKAANRGTVFFDEIGDMSAVSQAKLLRIVEDRELRRLGSTDRQPLDLRIIAATNQPLEQLINEGRFRADLFYRLNVGRIHVPPLRDRREEIPLLVDHFIRELNTTFGAHVEGVTRVFMYDLLAHSWPGNVRELRNTLESCYVSRRAGRFDIEDAPRPIGDRLRRASDDERGRYFAELRAARGNKSLAARNLQCSRMTLYRKLAKFEANASDTSSNPRSTRTRRS